MSGTNISEKEKWEWILKCFHNILKKARLSVFTISKITLGRNYSVDIA